MICFISIEHKLFITCMLSCNDVNCMQLFQKLKTTIVCDKLYYISDEEITVDHFN